jgi:hypothetical protein
LIDGCSRVLRKIEDVDLTLGQDDALKCRSCKKGRYAPPAYMIKLTREREITPYVWVHPNEDDRR